MRVHFRYGSPVRGHRASSGRLPFQMSMPLLMQRSIHETNTFQFVSSAKLSWRTEIHENKTETQVWRARFAPPLLMDTAVHRR
jgi:hypothetical protein